MEIWHFPVFFIFNHLLCKLYPTLRLMCTIIIIHIHVIIKMKLVSLRSPFINKMPSPEEVSSTLVSQVMNHPMSYPDVFVSIFLGFDLDRHQLNICSQVCRHWREFINSYLWSDKRVSVCDHFLA